MAEKYTFFPLQFGLFSPTVDIAFTFLTVLKCGKGHLTFCTIIYLRRIGIIWEASTTFPVLFLMYQSHDVYCN